jgi:hypothetical protein
MQELIEQAMNGDAAALRLCVERLPARRRRPMPGFATARRQVADPGNPSHDETTIQWKQ